MPPLLLLYISYTLIEITHIDIDELFITLRHYVTVTCRHTFTSDAIAALLLQPRPHTAAWH